MIKSWIAAAAVIIVAATAVSAAEPIEPTERPNVLSFAVASSDPSIEYRRMFFGSRLAVIAMGGYRTQSTEESAVTRRSSYRDLALGLGLRRNFNTAEQLRPFAQVEVLRDSSAYSGTCKIPAFWNYQATGGGEYFVGRRFSLEGSAGVTYGQGGVGCFTGGPTGTVGGKTIATFRSAVSVNFYF